MLDVFKADAFSMASLTAAVDMLPIAPSRLGQLGLFKNKPVTQRTVVVDERNGVLVLIPTAAPGTYPNKMRHSSRKARNFTVPHIPITDEIMAADVSGIRAFGSEDRVEAVTPLVNDRLTAMKQSMEVTWEYHRIGAIHGNILDADGTTVIYNLFTEFGVTEQNVSFNFTDAGTYDAPNPTQLMKDKCVEIKRLMKAQLGGTAFRGIHAFCGDSFFDNFVGHATVRKAFELFQQNGFARTTQEEQPFEFGGIMWENYSGSVGSVDFIDTDQCRFVPIGVNGLFQQINAPADFIETVNTPGKPFYVKQNKMKYDTGIELLLDSNPLFMCTRPGCLIEGTDDTP